MHKLTPLAAVFVVLLALTVYRESQQPSAGSLSAEMDLRPLAATPFAADEVTSISVAGPGQSSPDFTLSRRGEGEAATWVLDQPFMAPAAAGAVAALIDAVSVAEGDLRAENPSVLKRFHLTEDTQTTVELKGAGGGSLAHFAVGKTSHGGAFVRLLGGEHEQRAYAVTNNLRGALGLPPTPAGEADPEAPSPIHFQDKAFPPLQLDGAVRVELVTPRHRTLFEKQGRAWSAIEGGPSGGVQVKMDAITKVLGSLSGALQPSGLADPARRAEVGLTTPAYRLLVTLADGAERGFAASVHEEDGARTAKHYFRLESEQDPDVVYELSERDFAKVFPRGTDLFQLPALAVHPATLGRIVVESEKGRLAMERSRGGRLADWNLVEPSWELPTQQSALRSLVALIEAFAPVDWVEGAPPEALGAPEVTLRFGSVGAPDEALLALEVFGAAPGGGRLARMPGAQGLVVLEDDQVARLEPEHFSLFTKQVLSGWDERLVHTLQVVRAEGGERKPHFVLSSLGGAWKLSREGTSKATDEDTVGAWVQRLIGLRVNEVTDTGAEPAYFVTLQRQLGDPVTLGLSESQDGERTLTLGDRRFTVDDDDLLPEADSFLPAQAEESGTEDDTGTQDEDEDDDGDGEPEEDSGE